MIPIEALLALARREGKRLVVNNKVLYEPPNLGPQKGPSSPAKIEAERKQVEAELCQIERQKQDSPQRGESSR